MKDSPKGIDELYALFKKRKRIPLSEAAKLLGISERTALRWAKALEEDGILKVEKEGRRIYLGWMSFDVVEKPRVKGKELLEYADRVEEIRRKASELRQLEKERASIIYEAYIPMERRFEAELQLLNEELRKKKEEIAVLEKEVRALPEKLMGVKEKTEKLAQIEMYARRSLAEAKVRIEAEVARIRSVEEAVDNYLKEASLKIEEQNAKLKNIEKEMIRLKKLEQWMEMQRADIERRLEEVSAERKIHMKEFSALKATLTKSYIKSFLDQIKKLKERHEKELYLIRKREEDLRRKIKKKREELRKLVGEVKGRKRYAGKELEEFSEF